MQLNAWLLVPVVLILLSTFAFLTVPQLEHELHRHHQRQPNAAELQRELKKRLEQRANRVHAAHTTVGGATALPRKNYSSVIDYRHRGPLVSERVRKIRERLRYWDESQPRLDAFDKHRKSEEQFLVWQTWSGGFNNDRMSLEIAFVMAMMMQRTLVLPPPYPLYLLKPSQLTDYFCIDGIRTGVRTISFREFCERFGIEAPAQRVVWQGDPVWPRIKTHPDVRVWSEWTTADGGERLSFAYPDVPTDEAGAARMRAWMQPDHNMYDYWHNATLHEPRALYIEPRQLFDHFYTHFYFGDFELHLRVLRAVRDHVHYVDRVWRIAADVVAELPDLYNAVHVRRGDFQYKDISTMSPEKIIDNTVDALPLDRPLWLATDERNASFKEAWTSRYNRVYYLDMFNETLARHRTPSIWMGLIEQIVCSQAHRFVGTRLSTFSGYINRLRGYMRMRHLDTHFTTERSEEWLAKEDAGEGEHGMRAYGDEPSWKVMRLSGNTWLREFQEAHNWGDL